MILLAAKATLAILIALGIGAAARRARASRRHGVYTALFVFLLLLPFAPRLVPAFNVPVPDGARAPLLLRSEQASPAAAGRPRPAATAAVSGPGAERPATAGESARAPWVEMYAAGALLMLAFLAAGVVRLRRWAARGEVWLDGTRLATAVACESGIRRAVLVVLSAEISVPITFGFRRQTIVLPLAAREWDDDSLRRALRHELEHVRRDDWAVQLLARVACAIWWPHPLVWLALGRFCAEAERACDDAVVGTFEPASYADQLVSLARTVARRPRVPALAMASPTRLAERVHAILDPGQRRGPYGRIAGLATIGIMAAALAASGSVRIVGAPAVSGGVSGSVPGALDERDELFRDTAVRAAERGDVRTLGQLLGMGLNVNTPFDGDGTPLLIAARHGHRDAAGFLLDHGADPNVPSPGDGNPLIAAAGAGRVEIVKLLLDRGARIDEIVPGDENALMTAAANEHENVVRLLIDRGADVSLGVWVDRADGRAERRTPLCMARRSGNQAVIRMLIAAGAHQ